MGQEMFVVIVVVVVVADVVVVVVLVGPIEFHFHQHCPRNLVVGYWKGQGMGPQRQGAVR